MVVVVEGVVLGVVVKEVQEESEVEEGNQFHKRWLLRYISYS
jgi:hypothetical protein